MPETTILLRRIMIITLETQTWKSQYLAFDIRGRTVESTYCSGLETNSYWKSVSKYHVLYHQVSTFIHESGRTEEWDQPEGTVEKVFFFCLLVWEIPGEKPCMRQCSCAPFQETNRDRNPKPLDSSATTLLSEEHRAEPLHFWRQGLSLQFYTQKTVKQAWEQNCISLRYI